jgi:hypothetical protein
LPGSVRIVDPYKGAWTGYAVETILRVARFPTGAANLEGSHFSPLKPMHEVVALDAGARTDPPLAQMKDHFEDIQSSAHRVSQFTDW